MRLVWITCEDKSCHANTILWVFPDVGKFSFTDFKKNLQNNTHTLENLNFR